MRVLHLIDPGSPGGGACTLQLIADATERLTSVHQDVLIFGHREHVQLAHRCGVSPAGQLCGPRGVPGAGRTALRAWMNEQEHAAGRYDIVHAWTPRMAILVMLATRQHRRLATLSVGPLSGVPAHILVQLLRQRPMPIVATSTAVEREYRSIGVPSECLGVLPPAVHSGAVDMTSRGMLRERWGVDDRATVVGLLSEPVNWADAHLAMNVVMRVAATGRTVRLLLHPTAYRRAEAEWLMRSFHDESLMIIDDEVAEPWQVVQGLDVALLIGGPLNVRDEENVASPWSFITGGGRRLRPMPGIMPLLWAMTAGKPIVAQASNAVADIVQDGINGFLVHANDINPVCDRMLRLCDDDTIGHRLGANAQKTVEQRFHVSAYAVRLKQMYEGLMKNRRHRPMHVEDDHAELDVLDVEEPVIIRV